VDEAQQHGDLSVPVAALGALSSLSDSPTSTPWRNRVIINSEY
jgi:hypothetical protein